MLLFCVQASPNVTPAVDARKQSIIFKVASSMKQIFEFSKFTYHFFYLISSTMLYSVNGVLTCICVLAGQLKKGGRFRGIHATDIPFTNNRKPGPGSGKINFNQLFQSQCFCLAKVCATAKGFILVICVGTYLV